jgi:predicted nucleic acid-binding protein
MAANEALRRLESSETRILRVEVSDEHRAREIFDRFPGNGYTLTDSTCFAIMERLGISIAFTFDHHFATQGFTIPT